MTSKLETIEAALQSNLKREERINSQNTDLHLETRKALAACKELRDEVDVEKLSKAIGHYTNPMIDLPEIHAKRPVIPADIAESRVLDAATTLRDFVGE